MFPSRTRSRFNSDAGYVSFTEMESAKKYIYFLHKGVQNTPGGHKGAKRGMIHFHFNSNHNND